MRRPAEAPDEGEWLTDGRPLDPAVLDGAMPSSACNGASIGRFPGLGRPRPLCCGRASRRRGPRRAVRELGADSPAYVSASGGRLLRVVAGRGAHRGRRRAAIVPGRPHGRGRRPPCRRRPRPRRRPAHIAVGTRDGVLQAAHPFDARGSVGSHRTPGTPSLWIPLVDEVRAIRARCRRLFLAEAGESHRTDGTAAHLGFALARVNRPFLLAC